jgi:peptide/nickel transport system ATP-binding protein/oligopeptide transport system ATP-binding protein
MNKDTEVLLNIEDLVIHFTTYEGIVRAVEGVDFSIRRGEIYGLVGETGCGKSVTANSIMRLVPCPPGKIVSGTITFRGQDVLSLNQKEMRDVNGNRISIIFQDPSTALNPVYKIGKQMTETLIFKQNIKNSLAREKVKDLLQLVGMADPNRICRQYPHELSGGMQQRVMIAMALLCEPDLLIADEPTTALDVTTQMQILELILRLQEKLGFSVLIITHDLGVTAEFCHRISVMYAGSIVESGLANDIFENPQHPYTKGLLNAIPKIYEKTERLGTIPGMLPGIKNYIEGCKFSKRCDRELSHCAQTRPELIPIKEDHMVACWLYNGEK